MKTLTIAVLAGAAALGGLFSGGPLSRRQATDPGGFITVVYERFQRYSRPVTMEITIEQANSDVADILLSSALAEAYEIETIRPEPESAKATSGGILLSFPVPSLPVTIRFNMRPEKRGNLSGAVSLHPNSPAILPAFVYP